MRAHDARGVLLHGALVVAGLALIRLTIVGVYRVPTGSMIPEIHPGDLVLVDLSAYGGPLRPPALPARGDVVLATHPRRALELLVKRVVGVPGDIVGFIAGQATYEGAIAPPDAFVAGEAWDGACRREPDVLFEETAPDGRRTTVRRTATVGVSTRERTPSEVQPGQLRLVGDNRDDSIDSRVFGDVPGRAVHGAVLTTLGGPDRCEGGRWRAPHLVTWRPGW